MAAADHRKRRDPQPARDPKTSRLSTKGFVRGLVLILSGSAALTGMTYLVGPTPTTPSLVAMAGLLDTVGGMRAWGGLLVAAGVGIAFRWYLAGHGLATLVLMIWAGCSVVSVAQGTATAVSGPAFIGGWALIHAWCLYARRASRWSP